MTLIKEDCLRQGNVALTVFRGEPDGQRLVSFEKHYRYRKKFGPLFSEEELRLVLKLVLRLRRSAYAPLLGTANRRAAPVEVSRMTPPRLEIQEAIAALHKETVVQAPAVSTRPKMTVVSPLPKFTWRHTCRRCRCHVESRLKMLGTELKLCSNCAFVHAGSPGA